MLSIGRPLLLVRKASVFLLLSVAVAGCRHKSPDFSYIVMPYSENPKSCRGCPRFQVDFSSRGHVSLHCFSDCGVPGFQYYQIPEAEFGELVRVFSKSRFFRITRLDTRRGSFHATAIRLSYKDENGVHETIDAGRQIPALTRLEKQLRDAANVDPRLKPSLSTYQKLVSSGWDVNTVGEDQENALTAAVLAHDLDSVNFLLQHASRVTRGALTYSTFGSREIAEALFDAIHLDARGPLGGDLLRNAAERNPDVTRLLLRRGADPNSPAPESGQTPLMSAVSGGMLENVSLLLAKGANVNLKDHSGRGPLWLAARELNSGFTTLLLGGGAKVNSQDWFGQTALMQASEACFYWNVAPLLAGGADPSITDKNGHSALDLPAPADYPKCEQTLRLLKTAARAKAMSLQAGKNAGENAGFTPDPDQP